MTPDFMTHFSAIDDPRIERCKKHQLIDILFLSVCAVMSGAEGWEDIEDFGRAKLDWLTRYLPFSNGIPKHDTIARVLSRLDPSEIQQCFINWVQAIAQQAHGHVIAIDGKSARRTFTTKGRTNPLHMVSAWCCHNGLVLGQHRVDSKHNEITAIPTLLDLLDVRGSIVTLDAMGTQQRIAKQIVDKGADYILALKGNQGLLNDEVQAWFHKAQRDNYQAIPYAIAEQTDTGHGRIEVRTCTQLEIPHAWLTHAKVWPHINTVMCVQSQRHIGESVTSQTRYYISSLALDAERANQAIRNHWGVENNLHWTLDMTFREDESRIRRGHAAEVLNALRKIVMNIIKLDTSRKASMKRKRKMAALDDDFRAALLIGDN